LAHKGPEFSRIFQKEKRERGIKIWKKRVRKRVGKRKVKRKESNFFCCIFAAYIE
jgi:hypothetical protein